MPPATSVRSTRRPPTAVLLAGCLALAGSGPGATAAPSVTGTGVSPDRANKACLARQIRQAPGVILFGSSIFSKGDPQQVRALTRRAAFNASVSHGNPDDAWAFLHLVHDAHPAPRQELVWLLDPETFRGRGGPDRELLSSQFTARYARPRYRDAQGETASQQTARQARTRAFRQCVVRTNSFTRYRADGYRSHDYHDRNLAAGQSQADAIQATVDEYRAIYRDHYPHPDARLEARFESTIRLANGWGTRPIVVLAPMHPRFVAALAPFGYQERSRQVVRFLDAAAQRESFTLLDARRLSAFGGAPADFFDGVHLQAPAVRKLVAWVFRNAPGSSRLP